MAPLALGQEAAKGVAILEEAQTFLHSGNVSTSQAARPDHTVEMATPLSATADFVNKLVSQNHSSALILLLTWHL